MLLVLARELHMKVVFTTVPALNPSDYFRVSIKGFGLPRRSKLHGCPPYRCLWEFRKGFAPKPPFAMAMHLFDFLCSGLAARGNQPTA
jgi:hypothetical protein